MIFSVQRFLPVWLFLFTLVAAGQDCSCSLLDNGAENRDSLFQSVSKSSNKFCRAKYLEWLAVKTMDDNDMDSAGLCFTQAGQAYEQLQCPEADKVYLYKMWAGYFYRQGDFPAALDRSLKLSHAAEQSGDVYERANVSTMIAGIFNQMQQADKGIVYARKAVPLMQQVTDERKKIDLLFKISKRYLWHYQDYGYEPSLDSFEIFAKWQLRLSK
jgi:hypothetical protein